MRTSLESDTEGEAVKQAFPYRKLGSEQIRAITGKCPPERAFQRHWQATRTQSSFFALDFDETHFPKAFFRL